MAAHANITVYIDNDNYYHYQGSYYVMLIFRDARAFRRPDCCYY